MEYEWKDFQGFTTLGNLDEIQKMMAELKFEPEQFQGRIIFMSRHNVTFLGTPGNEGKLFYEFRKRCNICQEVSERM